jgi:hypothetical protein
VPISLFAVADLVLSHHTHPHQEAGLGYCQSPELLTQQHLGLSQCRREDESM